MRSIRVKAKKVNIDEYEVVFTMDRKTMEIRLAQINDKIRSLERTIELYTEQLEALRAEKTEIETILARDKV